MLASRSEIASCQSWPFSAAVTSAPKVTTLQQKMAASRGCFVVTLTSAFEWHLLQWKDLPFPEVRHNHESQWLFLNNSTSPPKNWSLTRRWASLGCNPAAQAVTAILRMCLTGSNQGSRDQSYEILMAPHLVHHKTDSGCACRLASGCTWRFVRQTPIAGPRHNLPSIYGGTRMSLEVFWGFLKLCCYHRS